MLSQAQARRNSLISGCSSGAEPQLSKLLKWVRFPITRSNVFLLSGDGRTSRDAFPLAHGHLPAGVPAWTGRICGSSVVNELILSHRLIRRLNAGAATTFI